MAPVLLSRGLDPLLGIFTGFFAYYLHETHPRTALARGETLVELAQWKWDYHQKRREESRGLEAASQST